MERLIDEQLFSYLETRGLLDRFQTEYRKYHSTETALLKLKYDIRESMDSKYDTLLMLFDFSKAFDSVNHVVLLQKVRQANLSVSAIKWIASYLTGRKQAVLDTNGVASSFTPLNKGFRPHKDLHWDLSYFWCS